MDDISHLQYTSGSTRPPVGVEMTHRAVGTNLVQMILSIDLLDRNTHGVSWLPLYHDMGLSMIGFPAVYGGHSTLMSPIAFVRRPLRWIQALSAARDKAAWLPPRLTSPTSGPRSEACPPGDDSTSQCSDDHRVRTGQHRCDQDLQQGVCAVRIATYRVQTLLRHRGGDAVRRDHRSRRRGVRRNFDREQLGAGHAVPVAADAPNAVAQVSVGRVARSLWAVIVNPETHAELADGEVGEIWLQGSNIGRGYWGMPDETRIAFGAKLSSRLGEGSHANGSVVDGTWLRTADLGVYLEGELYVTGRIVDLMTIDGRNHYPEDIEATAADASPMVRRGYVTTWRFRPRTPGR